MKMTRALLGVILATGSTGAITLAAGPAEINGPATPLALAERLQPPNRNSISGCPIFPTDNPWNTRVDQAPLRARSTQTIAAIQSSGSDFLHADFGENPAYGIPFVVVPETQPGVPIVYTVAGDESDPGPFPIPLNAPVEAGSDRHVIALQVGTCRLYELFAAQRSGGGWSAYSGASFDLRSNALRPLGWTSADAAGLPILPGLVRYEEVASGAINHAIRVTMSATQRAYILPATHFASDNTNADLPPMGLRLRLKANYDVDGLSGQARVIAMAMQQYGLIVADNGSNWFFQGAPSTGWIDDELNQLTSIQGTAFEVVDTGPAVAG
jgi:hypothetical protein